ncbi:MAG: GGDEF domain-containing protein [Chloroflexi bacterium]|nr:GGDEF domain-containing protein [Chloroflexota bacterium]
MSALVRVQKVLEHLATHDPLTGILNRRAILELLAKECSRTERGSKTGKIVGLSIGYFDLDNFKQFNDKYGHQVGDEVLKGVVGVLNSRMRKYDSIGRLGGDEFLVVAPDTEEENGEHLFERLAQAIADFKLQTSAGELSITVSIGVASVGDNEGLDQFLDCADEAMYRAKRAGRKPEENLGSD